MNAEQRILKVEAARFKKGKILPIVLAVFVLFQFVFFFFVIKLPESAYIDARVYITDEATYLAKKAAIEEGTAPSGTKTFVALYEHVYKDKHHNYGHYSYLPGLNSYGMHYDMVEAFYNAASLFHFILLLLSIAIAVYVFSDYSSGGIKNLLCSRADRDSVYLGKLKSTFALIIATFCVTMLIGTIFTARYFGRKILTCAGGRVRETVFAETFFTNAIAFLILDAFAATFTAFLTVRYRKSVFSIALPAILLLAFGALYFVLRKVNFPHFYRETRALLLSFVPVFRAFFDPNPAFSWQKGLFYAVDLALGALMIRRSLQTVRRQEI